MKERTYVSRIVVGATLLLMAYILYDDHETLGLVIYVASYLILGFDILYTAARNITQGRVFDENFLMSIATIGAFAIGEYPEGVLVMLLYQTGELFQRKAVNRSRRSIAELMDIQPEYANLENADATLERVHPSDVSIDDIVVVKPGEKIPLDGMVISGMSMADTSALTGESVPRSVKEGDTILSGFINLSGVLRIRVTKTYSDSAVSRILEMVEDASIRKSSSEQFITKFARYYTPAVVLAALLIALVPPIVLGVGFNEWIYRALVFLVISCPCALVISVPLTFFGGIGGASRNGILVKGGNYIEALANAETVIFDKTGTLTKGTFEVTGIVTKNMSQTELLKFAAYAESYSNHPVAESLRRAYGDIDMSEVQDVTEIPGHGVKANVFGGNVSVGNRKLISGADPDVPISDTIVHVSVDDVYEGYITISDEIKEDSWNLVNDLKGAGVQRIVMLTGDIDSVGRKVANDLGFTEFYTEMLPEDKVRITEQTMNETHGKTLFVGDGVNDAPVLARADVGIAMGGLGSDAAIEAADVVMMTDEPSKVATAIRISKRTVRIAKQNIGFSLAVKAIIMVLGVMGIATMWEAIFADVGVMLLAVLNAMRSLRPISASTVVSEAAS